MKLSFAFLALAPAFVSGLLQDLYDNDYHNHWWCCTDGKCGQSCCASGKKTSDRPVSLSPPDPYIENFFYNPSSPRANAAGYVSNSEVWYFVDDAAAWCEAKFGYTCAMGGYACRDPHFKRWTGEWYDYHGECDLLFASAPNFAKGIGLEIQIRTKARYEYSFIEIAAMKIGDDILEVSSWGEYSLNGIANADLAGAHLGPFEIVYEKKDEKQSSFTIVTDDPKQVVRLKTFKDMVDVVLQEVNYEDFDGTVGMLGNYPHGKMMGRDGVTEFEDPNQFGQEWQVLGNETSLFSVSREPQYPAKCIVPDAKTMAKRRLGENGVTQDQAEAACEHWEAEHKDMCIYDTLATGDLELAAAGAF